jgi:anti-sigma regulatory factor (Ser/Thr protein kinase)
MISGPGDDVARVPATLDALARAHRLNADVVADMQVALDEIVSNILKNGFADGMPHRVDIALSVDPDRLTAEVEDDCAPFDPLAVPPPDISSALKDRPIGGLGVHFVRHLMTNVSYTRVGARNRLVLSKSLENEAAVDGVA